MMIKSELGLSLGLDESLELNWIKTLHWAIMNGRNMVGYIIAMFV